MADNAKLLEELDATVSALEQQPRGVAWGCALLMATAAKEIRRLNALVGAVSSLPADDQVRLDKTYGSADRKRP